MNALALHRIAVRAALSAANIFAWVFAFQLYLALSHDTTAALIKTSFLYLLAQIVTCLMTPYAARAVRNGVRRLMALGAVCAAAAFVLFGSALSGYFGPHVIYGVVAFAILIGVYRALYWIPYSIESAAESHMEKFTALIVDFCVAAAPLLVGIYLATTHFGFVGVMFATALLLCASLIPLMHVKERYERYLWGYGETFGHLSEPRYNKIVLAALSDGAQGAALYFLWPLAVFLLIGFSYATLGAILTLTLMLAIPIRLLSRSFIETLRLKESVAVRALLAGTAWIIRITVASPMGVVVVDTYHTFGATPPHSSSLIEHSADGGSFVDELTALKEVGMALGRILMVGLFCVISLAVALPQSLALTFLSAGIAAATAVWFMNRSEKPEF